ncbi:MAG TPA: PSD1 and planctomycete cytochrome C domain-containing protein, partial [Planctomycetaceae bacterium]|nr:PSD1 and planctomycete cytochrome C domain-containing protein [Planctomycetaceae bacterium]
MSLFRRQFNARCSQMMRTPSWFCVILIGSISAAELSAQDQKVSYRRDVRPILAAKCFACHGPDEAAREADLRLDEPEGAYAARGEASAIVPGKPSESEVWRRISSNDEFERMPPPDSMKSLPEQERGILKRWIEQGAEYETHWAFQAPQRPEVPSLDDDSWIRNDIDRFVLSKLRKADLQPNPEADRYTLVRRVSLDLIGIPPTPEQADRFVADDRPDAYERLVDELLASPHYGERWARRWLDLARYSDTNGYEKDRPRIMYPYRDWVIEAFNSDLPFDRFTIEQIAGDLLPDATESQRIATGFHRNTMLNEEGGVDPREFRFLAMVDRVNTTGTTWLGLTIGCAQCHTHKYDPVVHSEYYQMMAFLDNVNEPTIKVANPEIERQRQEIQTQLEQMQAALASKFPLPEQQENSTLNFSEEELRERHLAQEFEKWRQQNRACFVAWTMLTPERIETNLPDFTILDDQSILISGDYTKNDIFEVELKTDLNQITGFRVEALPDESLPFGGPGRGYIHAGVEKGGEFFLSEIHFFERNEPADEWNKRPISEARHSFARENRPSEYAIDGQTDTGWSISPRTGERHSATFRLAEPLANSSGTLRFKIRLEHESFHPSGLGRFRISVTDQGGELGAFDRPLAIDRLLQVEPDTLTDAQRAELKKFFLETTPLLAEEHKKIETVRQSMPEYPTTLVLQERNPEHHRTTYRHHRGEFLSPREPVEAAVLNVLHELPSDVEPDRLDFARWLVSRDNPLTARVVINRHWEAFFGRGIVKTTEDFGLQGELPTHPELLDWLAVEFMERGWSLKSMHKTIVSSATYRQSSVISDRKLQLDPENVWLSRDPRVRLEAELIRDNVLAISGLLSRKIGGPSVFPPQPPGITEAAYGPLEWKVSEGEDRYRRGLYTFNKRTAPYTMFSTFDAPSGELCLARREPS